MRPRGAVLVVSVVVGIGVIVVAGMLIGPRISACACPSVPAPSPPPRVGQVLPLSVSAIDLPASRHGRPGDRLSPRRNRASLTSALIRTTHGPWCNTSELIISADWQGVNTTRIGGVLFVARADAVCRLEGRPRIEVYGGGHRLHVLQRAGSVIGDATSRPERIVTVRPGREAGAAFDWENWCRPLPSPPMLLRVKLPHHGGQAPVYVRYGRIRHSSTTPACLAPSRPSTITVGTVRAVTLLHPLP